MDSSEQPDTHMDTKYRDDFELEKDVYCWFEILSSQFQPVDTKVFAAHEIGNRWWISSSLQKLKLALKREKDKKVREAIKSAIEEIESAKLCENQEKKKRPSKIRFLCELFILAFGCLLPYMVTCIQKGIWIFPVIWLAFGIAEIILLKPSKDFRKLVIYIICIIVLGPGLFAFHYLSISNKD